MRAGNTSPSNLEAFVSLVAHVSMGTRVSCLTSIALFRARAARLLGRTRAHIYAGSGIELGLVLGLGFGLGFRT